MGSTASDMEYGVFDNIEDASDFLAYRMKENELRDEYAFAKYEFSYVIDGIDPENECPDEEFDYILLSKLEATARVEAASLVIRFNEEETKRKAKVAEQKAEQIRQQELVTLAQLQEKHGKLV